MQFDKLTKIASQAPQFGSDRWVPNFEIPDTNFAERNILGELFRVLLKRRWTILVTLVIVVTTTSIVSFRMKKIYQAYGRIVVSRENSESMAVRDRGSSDSGGDFDYAIELDTQVKILQSNALATEVMDKMSHQRVVTGAQAGSGMSAAQLNNFKTALAAATIRGTRMIEVRFSSSDPRQAAETVNAVMETYIEDNIQNRYESVMRASDFLSKQLSDLKVKVETSQEKLVEYQKENGIIGIDEKQNIITNKLDQLNKDLLAAQADRMQKEADYRVAQGGNAALIAKVDATFAKMQSTNSDLRSQLAQLQVQFGESYPKVAELTSQLKESEAQIRNHERYLASRLKAEYEAALKREQLLRATFEQQKLEATRLNEKAIEYSILKRDADSNRQLYEGLLQRLKEAGVSAGLKSSNIRIVDRARVPTLPARPNIPRNIGLSFLIALVTGVGFSLVLESLDQTVSRPEELEQITGVPCLATVPSRIATGAYVRHRLNKTAEAAGQQNNNISLAAHSSPQSSISEAYRALRTSVLLSSPDNRPNVVLVTSASPQEGKTTTTVNFAIVLAQRGARVLLLDCDLRRPTVHKIFGQSCTEGLTTLLTDPSKRNDVVRQYPSVPNLSYVVAGPIPPRPADLLQSAVFKQQLDRWRVEFDHVVIDSPPVLSVTDAVILATMVDSVILVAKAGLTSKGALRRARDILERVHANVTGVVCNHVPLHELSYYYGSKSYRYSGYYRD